MRHSENLKETLNKAGRRATSQRSLILGIIRRGEGHLDADEIYRRARQKHLRISLSTVYRTLRTLKSLGLIEELHFDEHHHHYELKPATEHHHLRCLNCGRVVEFHSHLSNYIEERIPEAKGFDIVNTEVNISGYCPDCCRESR